MDLCNDVMNLESRFERLNKIMRVKDWNQLSDPFPFFFFSVIELLKECLLCQASFLRVHKFWCTSCVGLGCFELVCITYTAKVN